MWTFLTFGKSSGYDQNESTLTSDEKSQIREDNLLQPSLRSNTNVENE